MDNDTNENKDLGISMEELEAIAGGRGMKHEEFLSMVEFTKNNLDIAYKDGNPYPYLDLIHKYEAKIDAMSGDSSSAEPYLFETFLKDEGII